MMLNPREMRILSFFIVTGILMVDQLCKKIVVTVLGTTAVRPILNGWLQLHLTLNASLGFSLGWLGMGSMAALLVHAMLMIMLCVIFAIASTKKVVTSGLLLVSLSLLLGSGVSNLLDRILWGGVLDWIEVPSLGSWNVADMAIWIGVVLLLIDVWWYNTSHYRVRTEVL